MNYWLIKSEPEVYSIADLRQDQKTLWEGVRNYQARNFLRQMDKGDLAFFYHSNTKPPGIVGLVRVVTPHITDPTQFDPDSQYYDPKSSLQSPRWHTVVVEFVKTFPSLISLETLKQFSAEELWVVRRGNRLSVMPVSQAIAEKLIKISSGDFDAASS